MRSTMMDFPLLISRILEHGVSVHGGSEVVTWTGGAARRMTYAALGAQAARLAHALHDDLGVDGDQRVATFMWNNAEHLAAYLAVPSMGAVLHTLNIRLSAGQLGYVASHAEDRVIIVDATLIPLLAKVIKDLPCVQHVIVAGGGDPAPLAAPHVTVHAWESLLAGKPDTYPWPEFDERDAAAICYTSGTTGDPKGVAYSHRSVWLHSMQVSQPEAIALSPHVRSLVVVPMFHAMAWGIPYSALLCGASLILPDRFLQAAALAEMIVAEHATSAAAVPTIWNDLLAHLEAHPQIDIGGIKEVLVGGSACPPALMHAFARRGVAVIHGWGMTETSPLGAVSRPPAGLSEQDAWVYRYKQGRLPAGVMGRIVGADGTVAPRDGRSVGELQVRGPWVTARYLGTDDSDRFHDGWLRTGDVGTLCPMGFLTLTDRAKDVIKSGGEWISSLELENHLMAHPAVLEAAVVGVPDPRWDERPLATVVVRQGHAVTIEALRQFLGERVARWQLPERWAFVTTLPKTSVGKLDKKLIRAQYAEGVLAVQVVGESPARQPTSS
jgi:fatty-acyl-CoA synthase